MATSEERRSVDVPTTGVHLMVKGDGMEVEYLDGAAPELRVSEGEHRRVFTADELRREPTVLGTLATGTVDAVPDLGERTVTLAVPDVNLRGDGGEAPVETFLVRTLHRTSIGGPSLVDGALQVHEVVALYGVARALDEPAVRACFDWRAIHDLEPPGPGRLRVTGRCVVPTPGHRVELRRAEPQGINPRDLLLEKVVLDPEGVVIQVITEVDAEFSEVTDATIDTVTILPDGVSVPVQRAL